MSIKLLDCTIRDGGYTNNWNFSDADVVSCYSASCKSRFDYFEIGFRTSTDDHDVTKFGKWFFSDDNDINMIVNSVDLPHKSKIAVMATMRDEHMDINMFKHRNDCNVDMVRVHLPYQKTIDVDLLDRTKKFMSDLINYGYMVTLNITCIDKYEPDEIAHLVTFFKQVPYYALYFADTYGSCNNDHIALYGGIASDIHKDTDIVLGFHSHNNLQDSLEKTKHCINNGFTVVDSCMGGLGRGAGNLCSELLVCYLSTSNTCHYDVVPLLEHINNYIYPYHKLVDMRYNVLYVLSGFLSIHPNYATEFIHKERQFTIQYIYETFQKILSCGNAANYDSNMIDNIS